MRFCSIKKFSLRMVTLLRRVSPFFVLIASAANADANLFGLKPAAQKGGFNITKSGSVSGAQEVIGSIIGQVLAFVGILFLILMIYGGLIWMIGGKEGKEGEIDKAKKIIFAAVTGLVIIFSAYVITAFVTGTLGTAFGV